MPWIVLLLFMALLIPLFAVVLDSHLGRALADALSKRNGTALEDPTLAKRLAALESEVERLNNEVLRLEDETVFLHRLLADKPGSSGELPPGSTPS